MAWNVREVEKLDAEVLRQVLDREVAAISYRGYVDMETCRRSVEALAMAKNWSFYEGAMPPLGRLGMTQYEHFGVKDKYLDKAPAQAAMRREVLGTLPDPLETLLEDMQAVWSAQVRLAEEEGRQYFAGVFRRGTAATIHADWAPRDAAGWSIDGISAQLGWNVYYQLPVDGGELVVFDQPWDDSLEPHARQRFNDYDPAVFQDTARVNIRLAPGQLVIFNSRNMHEVTRASDGDQRVSVGSFIGEMPNRDLVFWS